MRVIAFYLPQYHRIPENDTWWGEGFTEWTNVKKAKPLFTGHQQPRIPLHGNYYDLSNDGVMEWQSQLAKEHGIYGFCFYHYWFSGHMLLEKPLERLVRNKALRMPFCICWANPSWTSQWVSRSDKILIEQKYGDKEHWKAHFEYLLPIFKDDRYILLDGKPLILLYDLSSIPMDVLEKMLCYWKELAVKGGLPGLTVACQNTLPVHMEKEASEKMDYRVEYQPSHAIFYGKGDFQNGLERLLRAADHVAYRVLGRKPSEFLINRIRKYNYDAIWRTILDTAPRDEKSIACAFTDWDNSPRRGQKSIVFLGGTPEKFAYYFGKLVEKSKDVYKKDIMFITAWNEWGEGCYLEPDESNSDGYLQAVKKVLLEHGEFPLFDMLEN